jgi:hypothetical protein
MLSAARPQSSQQSRSVQHKGDEQISLLWRIWRIFGRFYWARVTLGKFLGVKSHFRAQPATSQLFSSVAIAPCVRALQNDAVAFGFHLAPAMVTAIRDFAHTTPLIQENYATRNFSYADCKDGEFSDGAPIPLAYAKNARLCPEIMAIVNDPVILEIAARYLGFRPKYFRDRLWFSFTGNHDLAIRRQMNQTVDFHFDVSFYLSDVDLQSGAHTLIKGSHRNKPLWMKLGRSRRDVDALAIAYGKDFDTVISGPAGTGFLEDASCYHRALAPISHERLMLQIRYF